MPTKQDYKQIIEDKLSAQTGKNQENKDGVSSTIQESGSGPDVSTSNK